MTLQFREAFETFTKHEISIGRDSICTFHEEFFLARLLGTPTELINIHLADIRRNRAIDLA